MCQLAPLRVEPNFPPPLACFGGQFIVAAAPGQLDIIEYCGLLQLSIAKYDDSFM